MNPNDNRFGQGIGSVGSDAQGFGSTDDGWSASEAGEFSSRQPQDYLEADAILRESYITQPELDVEELDVSGLEVGASNRARWLLWGGLGLGAGLLAFKLIQRNRFVIQEKASSLKGMARDRIQSFRDRGAEEDESDSFILQENARPDMVSEAVVSDYSRGSSDPSFSAGSSSFSGSSTFDPSVANASFGSDTSLQSGSGGFSGSTTDPVSSSLRSYDDSSDGVLSGRGSDIDDDKNLGRS